MMLRLAGGGGILCRHAHSLLAAPRKLFFGISFCLFVCSFTGRIVQKLLDQFFKSSLEVGTSAAEEPFRFWW